MPSLQKGGDLNDLFNDGRHSGAEQTAAVEWCLKSDITSLLSGFFAFYVEEFRWGVEVVSVRLGFRADASLEEEFEYLYGCQTSRLHIEDPFEQGRNLNDVLGYPNEDALRQALRMAHASVCQKRFFELLPKAPSIQVGALAVSRQVVPAPPAGYLALELGELVEILHIGQKDDPAEAGWMYGRSKKVKNDAKNVRERHGWLRGEAVALAPCGVQAHFTDSSKKSSSSLGGAAVPVVACHATGSTKVLASVIAAAEGYASLTAGEEVLIQYIGSEQTHDAGWLFGQTASARGWFPAETSEQTVPGSSGGA